MPKEFRCPRCFAPFGSPTTHCTKCGANLENQNPPATLPVGTFVAERYIIADVCGADGEGVCYHAVDCTTSRKVQIKEYLPITLTEDRTLDGMVHPKRECAVMFKTTRMDFVDLYGALQSIANVEGLHTVLDVVEDNGTAYAVLAHLEGVSLNVYLKGRKEGIVSSEQANQLLAHTFEGIATLHAAGLIHRGISTDNIIVLPSGATCLTGYATIGLRTIGTALRPQLYEGYSAPEQYDTAAFEGRYTDVYCLAAVYYTMLTGQAPASAGERLVVDATLSARRLMPSVPRYVSDILRIALSIDPVARLQTVSDLRACLTAPERAQQLLRETKRATRKSKRAPLTGIIGTILIAVAMLICLIGWFFIADKRHPIEPPVPTATPTAMPTPTPEVVRVDDFTNLLYSQLVATSAYNDKYLFYVWDEQYSDTPVGTVLAQKPVAGSVLGDDVTIGLTISKGPELVPVPQIFGFTQDSAESELNAVGLTASFVMRVNDGSYASGCVIKTDPEAGLEVQTGTVVTVYIAADRDVLVVPTAIPTATPTAEPTATPIPSDVSATWNVSANKLR